MRTLRRKTERALDIVKSFIIFPFVAGNHPLVNYQTATGWTTPDGSISTVVLAAFLIGVVFVSISITTSQYSIHQDPDNAIRYVLITFVLGGIIGLSVLTFTIRKQGNESQSPRKNNKICARGLKLNFLKLFCLVVYTVAIFSIILRVERILSGFHIKRSIVSIIWNVLLIVFASGQIIFISLFYKLSSIVGNMRIYYGVNFVILSNVCLWFDSIIAEEVHLFHIRNETINNENNEMETFNCTGVTGVRCVFENVFPYLFPITAQYALVSISFVLKILAKTKQKKSTITEPCFSMNESSPLLCDDELDKPEATSHIKSRIWYFCVVFGISLVTVLLILVAVLMSQICNEEQVFRVLEKYRLFYDILLLVFAFLCFRLLWSQCVPTSVSKSFSTEEVILVFSSTAMTMYLLFQIHAVINQRKIIQFSSVTIAENIVSLLIVYYQTVLVLQSRRYRNFKMKRHFRISHVIMLMFIMNLGLWFNDSFLQKHVPYVMKEKYRIFDRRALDFMTGTLFPITEFYMFHLSLALFDIYCRFRP